MKKILDALTQVVGQGFVDSGYEASYGKVTISTRPDLCEFQCNGAMGGAKAYRKAPIMIANAVVEKLLEQNAQTPVWQEVTAVMPGFINY